MIANNSHKASAGTQAPSRACCRNARASAGRNYDFDEVLARDDVDGSCRIRGYCSHDFVTLPSDVEPSGKGATHLWSVPEIGDVETFRGALVVRQDASLVESTAK